MNETKELTSRKTAEQLAAYIRELAYPQFIDTEESLELADMFLITVGFYTSQYLKRMKRVPAIDIRNELRY